MKENINIAIIGATGLVGSKLIEIINESKDKYNNIYLFASKKSEGKIIKINNKDYFVKALDESIFDYKIDVAYFMAGGSISKEYAKRLSLNGVYVVDNSSYFRMDKDIPLIIPEVNINKLSKDNYLISNPNCSTIQSVLTLHVIDTLYDVTKVTYSTYQAVSGSGHQGLNDLRNTKDGKPNLFYHKVIYDNVIPQIDVFLEDGFTKEEYKMIYETNKILGKPLDVTATCVRVPVTDGHSVSINAITKEKVNLKELKESFQSYEGIRFYDKDYPTPMDSRNSDLVLVGRLRLNPSNDHEVLVWSVSDNLRKGAAYNAYKIGEHIIKEFI